MQHLTPVGLSRDGASLVLVSDAGEEFQVGIHEFAANSPMHGRFFYNADAEMVIVPPCGMASRAFTTILTKASSNSL